MLRAIARSSSDSLDRWYCSALQVARRPGPHLVVALCHSVLRTEADEASGLLMPQQGLTLDDLRRFLSAALGAGYAPISLADLDSGGPRTRNELLLTFDDGYFNNAWVLPILEEFEVPAAFFISTGHVRWGKAFWWDAAARALIRSGRSPQDIRSRLERLKRKPAWQVEAELVEQLGPRALVPVSDVDRPFRAPELRDFSRNGWVTLGNHTVDHSILTRCSGLEANAALAQGRRHLQEMTGVAPLAVAYPDGAHSPGVVDAAHRTGHRLGFTCEARANVFSGGASESMTIGRHVIPSGCDYVRHLRLMSATAVLPGAGLRSALRSLVG